MSSILPDLEMKLGEGPVWDARLGCLYWVDIVDCRLYRMQHSTGDVASWSWPEKISCLGLTDEQSILVVAGVSGLWKFDTISKEKSLFAGFPDLPAGQRPNDGKVGPDGAFWVGTMEDRSDRGPVGCLYRFAPDGTVAVKLEGLTTPNGIEWSPDGRKMYLAETREYIIDQYDFDVATGQMSGKRPFVRLDDADGKPDGAAVAVDGSYWVAGIYGGQIHGFAASGEKLESITVGKAMVTMPCFGGPDLSTLYVTSLADTRHGPGGLDAIVAPVKGHPTRFFGVL